MDSFNRVVANFMTRYGTTITVRVVTGQTYDYSTSENVPTVVEYTPRGMVFDFTLQSNGDQTQRGTLIASGDKQVYLEPVDGMPKLRPNKDLILIGGVPYNIVTYKETNPSQDNIRYIELFVRA